MPLFLDIKGIWPLANWAFALAVVPKFFYVFVTARKRTERGKETEEIETSLHLLREPAYPFWTAMPTRWPIAAAHWLR